MRVAQRTPKNAEMRARMIRFWVARPSSIAVQCVFVCVCDILICHAQQNMSRARASATDINTLGQGPSGSGFSVRAAFCHDSAVQHVYSTATPESFVWLTSISFLLRRDAQEPIIHAAVGVFFLLLLMIASKYRYTHWANNWSRRLDHAPFACARAFCLPPLFGPVCVCQVLVGVVQQ